MSTDDYNEWRECLDADCCELIASYMELIDAMVRGIQHLKAETIRARYELSLKFDPEHKWITTVDILSDLNKPHYESLAYQQYVRTYYDGGDPLSFKEYVDSMVRLAQGVDDETY
ncbi:MAG: hypothetical protein LIV24_04060 [Eubacterium sp.]|nr:hypothetical protein [Eubacterium sp.]